VTAAEKIINLEYMRKMLATRVLKRRMLNSDLKEGCYPVQVVRVAKLGDGGTHKIPSKKTPVRPILRGVESCKCQMTGSGSTRIPTSNIIFGTVVPINQAVMSTH